jgi:hypothetical protein
MTPSNKYLNDPEFAQVVDMLSNLVLCGALDQEDLDDIVTVTTHRVAYFMAKGVELRTKAQREQDIKDEIRNALQTLVHFYGMDGKHVPDPESGDISWADRATAAFKKMTEGDKNEI